ncbi:MAG TPA: hypothetical protein VIN40_09940 [Candidatus Tyrphobacter sp.]
MSLTRRELLKTGAAGVALLTLADCARRTSGAGLDATQKQVVAKIAGVMLDGAIPSDEPERALAEAVDGFVIAVAGLPPQTQGEVQQLFMLLTFPPTRRLIAGLPPWTDATPDDVAAFLTRWRFSGIQLLRSGYDALHQLVMAGWYGNNVSWPPIGYPGPPEIAG